MFCPKCGSPRWEWDFLFGGNCQFVCKNCGRTINCLNKPFSNEIIEQTIPTWNPLKVLLLRIKYIIKKWRETK